MVSIPACHAGDRGSIPRRGENILVKNMKRRVFEEQCLESSLLKKGVDTGDIRNDVYLSS